MKPRIFISIHYMEIGGAEISLIGLLNALDYSKVDVDLFIYAHTGELMNLIPRQVNILKEIKAYAMTEKPLKDLLCNGCLNIFLGRCLGKYMNRRFREKNALPKGMDDESAYQYMEKYVNPFLPKISETEYDLAINFCGMSSVILNKVNARKKITWLHTDYSMVSLDSELALDTWRKFDKIISISDNVTKAFLTQFPELKNKIFLIENILSSDFVRNRALEGDVSFEMKE